MQIYEFLLYKNLIFNNIKIIFFQSGIETVSSSFYPSFGNTILYQFYTLFLIIYILSINSTESLFEDVDILYPSNIGMRIVYFLFPLFTNLSLINQGFIFLKL